MPLRTIIPGVFSLEILSVISGVKPCSALYPLQQLHSGDTITTVVTAVTATLVPLPLQFSLQSTSPEALHTGPLPVAITYQSTAGIMSH